MYLYQFTVNLTSDDDGEEADYKAALQADLSDSQSFPHQGPST